MPNGRTGSRPRLACSLLGLFASLVLAPPVTAGYEYPAPAFFLDGLTENSDWREILAKPGIKAEFPLIGFETTFVSLESVCVDGSMLAIANPRLDTGVRVPADELRARVEAATAGRLDAEPGNRLAAAASTDPPRQVALRYPVNVYRFVERGLLRQHIFLFQKLWPIPTCPAK
jgi:hypothetical protein